MQTHDFPVFDVCKRVQWKKWRIEGCVNSKIVPKKKHGRKKEWKKKSGREQNDESFVHLHLQLGLLGPIALLICLVNRTIESFDRPNRSIDPTKRRPINPSHSIKLGAPSHFKRVNGCCRFRVSIHSSQPTETQTSRAFFFLIID